jgi:Beta-ketoacyl synthase, N-terminal domain
VLTFVVSRWVAWASGLERPDAWERWCRAPSPLAGAGSPGLGFLPPLFRRRCSALSRLMLHVAYEASGPDGIDRLPTVFASRYGELALTLSLLESLARSEPLTAAGFTHSVHNAQVGLFSIAARNREMATALSAGRDTFPCSILEALALTERAGGGPVLVVMADEPVPAGFDVFDDDPSGSYALALVIERAGAGHRVALDASSGDAHPARPPWPPAIEFLRWLLSDEPAITLGGRRAWTWRRW